MRPAVAILAALAALGFLALWIEHRSALTLPAPSGAFAIGRNVADWKIGDAELLIWTWYPARRTPGSDEYLPPATRRAILASRPRIINFLTRDFAKVHGNAIWNAPMLPQTFPVVLMRGGASAPVWNYSALAEDLASHGYIVVGIDAAGLTGIVVFPDGRIVRQKPENNPERCIQRGQPENVCAQPLLDAWIGNMKHVVDRLGASHVGVFGHSFGGAQALQFCQDDARCAAAVDVDGMPLGDLAHLQRPVTFVLSDHSGEQGSEKIMAGIRAISNQIVTIPHSNHFTFSDDGALLKSRIFRWMVRADARRQLAITREELRKFFDAHLVGDRLKSVPHFKARS